MSQESLPRIALPPPEMDGGRPLMRVLKERASSRAFSAKPVSSQTLANLLWAAAGVNRPDTGKRTAPSARDRREIMIFAITAAGTYRYNPDAHALEPVTGRDLRSLAGTQEFVSGAPLNLVYVVELAKMPELSPERQLIYSSTDAGMIAQNVYLFCASEGLSTVVRGAIDREALGAALGLSVLQRILIAQSVGFA